MRSSSVSILIPLYNEEEFIQELLDRVVHAPYPEGVAFEIIVVNDCSTDGSAEAVQSYIDRTQAPNRDRAC
jgi:glycosyltransferase involved in cell wall biosynthesis